MLKYLLEEWVEVAEDLLERVLRAAQVESMSMSRLDEHAALLCLLMGVLETPLGLTNHATLGLVAGQVLQEMRVIPLLTNVHKFS